MEIINLEHHPNDYRIRVVEEDVCQTLSNRMGTGGGNVPIFIAGGEMKIVYALQRFGEYKESDKASSLKYRDYKDTTDLVYRGGTYGDYPQSNARGCKRFQIIGPALVSGPMKRAGQESLLIVQGTGRLATVFAFRFGRSF